MPVYNCEGKIIGFQMQDGKFYCYECSRKEADFDPKMILCAVGNKASSDKEWKVTVCDSCGQIE